MSVPPRIVPDDLRTNMNPPSRFTVPNTPVNFPSMLPPAPDPLAVAPPHPAGLPPRPPLPMTRSSSYIHDVQTGGAPPPSSLQLALNPGRFGEVGMQQNLVEDLKQARREIELLKSMKDPFRAADLAVEIQVEKMKVVEATSARDSAVQRLSSAYDSIKQKTQLANKLQLEKDELERIRLQDMEERERTERAWAEEKRVLEGEVRRLTGLIECMKHEGIDSEGKGGLGEKGIVAERDWSPELSLMNKPASPTSSLPGTEDTDKTLNNITNGIDHLAISRPSSNLHSSPLPAYRLSEISPFMPAAYRDRDYRIIPPSRTLEEVLKARFAILASLPIPGGVPEDALTPINIPQPFTLYEFLGNATESLKHALAGYRAFQENATRWCPDREEHGYFLTPLFKCNTNPRVPTAHQWTEVDPKGRMTKPTECFYNNEGKWYYAGQYVALRLEDLTVKEWESLDAETANSLIKETLAGRKATSPQNHYETTQLYACGALRIACVGLQCVGFNTSLYRAIMEQANKCQQSGRWRTGWPAPISDPTSSVFVPTAPLGNGVLNPIGGGSVSSAFSTS